MKLLDNIRAKFASDKVVATKVIDLLNKGYSLMQISGDLYNIPEVRTAINFIAEKAASVPLYHIREDEEGNITNVNDKINFALTVRMNQKQGPQVFWTEAFTRALLYNNNFILPEWTEKGEIFRYHILPFYLHEFITDKEGKLKIRFAGAENYEFYYEDIIHLQRFPGPKGGAQKQATSNYIQIVNTIQNQAVKDSETSGRIAALLQVKTALKGPDMKKKLDEFKELFLSSENTTGFGMIGAEYDVHKLDLKLNPLNKELLDNVVKAIYNYFGVSPEIINHKASELEYEQWIDNTVKPWIYQTEEEITYKSFSEPEIYRGNKISAEFIDLEISTLQSKTTFFKEMIFGGVINRNEVRKRIGLKKGPAELDKFQMSKNFENLQPGNYVVEGGETGE